MNEKKIIAIAINPDVRELDFSDNVKVSKFMQDFSDFRAKKWITYRPVNAPSESEPFLGGTRQFIINMGTGHILDTTYSGLWYTITFVNVSDKVVWPIQCSLPRTSMAWIESVTFQHSKVAAHIDERVCDYDSASTIFTPTKDINSMKQTFFTTTGQTFLDDTMYNELAADDPYGKLMTAGNVSTGRISYQTKSFFIPLRRLSTIFNSGKYFFPSLLRGNGEMTISIRSVAQSLSEIFGSAGSSCAVYLGPYPGDKLWSTTETDPLIWTAHMIDMKLITLNLDNAFLTKEYNAFIASGRKFIRSFKSYNYQFYQVKAGYNRIEIANTHQSISHIVLAFQAPYSIRTNGKPTSAIDDQSLGIQRTTSGTMVQVSNNIASNLYAFTPAGVTTEGNAKGSSEPAPTQRILSNEHEEPVPSALRQNAITLASKTVGAVGTTLTQFWPSIMNLITTKVQGGSSGNLSPVGQQQPTFKGTMLQFSLNVLGNLVGSFFGKTSLPIAKPMLDRQKDLLYESYLREYVYTDSDRMMLDRKSYDMVMEALQQEYGRIKPFLNLPGGSSILNSDVSQISLIMQSWKATHSQRTDREKKAMRLFGHLYNVRGITRGQAAILAYYMNVDDKKHIPVDVKNYLTTVNMGQADLDAVDAIINDLANKQAAGPEEEDSQLNAESLASGAPATVSQSRMMTIPAGLLARGAQGNRLVQQIMDSLLARHLVPNANGVPASNAPFTDEQRAALIEILGELIDDQRVAWHRYHTHMFPSEAKQIYDIGMNVIEKLQVYRGTGNGETVFSEPINENMFYHVSREAMGDSAEDHPYFNYMSFRKDMAVIVISLNTFMRDAHHEFWDGFSTNRVADRLYVEFENVPVEIPLASNILPWYQDVGYNDNCDKLNCKVFTVYDNIYYIDRDNNLNVSDTLLPLQEGRIPGSD